ncbi:MAG: DUF3179 domain-containing protein [Alcanivoracaceae bacterium]|nr:DUF3179 domain-containing protein [Alcanivoracaceae bacterium]
MKIRLVISLLIISSLSMAQENKPENTPENKPRSNILKDFFHITDDSQSDYPIKDILQGCPRVDCIPSIDNPEFMPATEVDFLKDHDLIIAITIDKQTRVYPTTTLQQHEIVNDQIGDIPFAVTYCPLCGTGDIFSRKVKGEVVEFGVSGVLHGSDLVMYDRKNNNLWQQLTGKSFAGPDRGYQLETLPLVMTDWKTWLDKHPDSMVLSNSKDKINDHYEKYRNSDKIMYGGVTDPRLNPKRVIYGVTIDDQAIALDFEMIKSKNEQILKAADTELLIQYKQDGTVIVMNDATKKVYPTRRAYWFAWYTFNPNTLLFK